MSKSLSDNLNALMHALAASVEAFLHHTFGERYATVMLHTLLLTATVSLAAPVLAPETPAPFMPWFTAAFFVRLLAHLVAVWRRRRAGVHVQSNSSGISWSIWSQLRLPAGVIHGIVEPLVCLAAAFLVSPFDPVFSYWLRFAALALMIKTMIHRRQAHEEMLDTLDDRTAARNRHAAVQPQANPRLETQQQPVTVNAPVTTTPARPLPGLFRNLDPALQRLMQQNVATTEPGQIQVRPANPRPHPVDAAPPSATPLPRPRVVLVRTRPAPAPLRVKPASAVNPNAENDSTARPRPQPTVVPNRSEPAPVPTPAEVRNTQAPKECLSSSLPSTSSTNEATSPSCDPAQGIEERVREEAVKLGFVVGRTSAEDLTLTKSTLSLAIKIAVNTTTAQEVENVKRCLASGITRVAIVSPTPERIKVLAEAMHAGLPLEQVMRVSYHTPDEVVQELHRLAQAAESPTRKKRARAADTEKRPN